MIRSRFKPSLRFPPRPTRRHVPMSPRSLRGPLLALASLVLSFAHAAAFTPGNIVVYRIGDGSAALSNLATPVFLDEYSPAGSLVQTVPLPTVAAGANNPLTGSGTATSEGLLTRSTDKAYLLLPGYKTAPGTASITTSTSAAIPRV